MIVELHVRYLAAPGGRAHRRRADLRGPGDDDVVVLVGGRAVEQDGSRRLVLLTNDDRELQSITYRHGLDELQ